MHDQQRRADACHLADCLEALGDQHRQRHPAPFAAADHVGNRRESAFDDRSFFVGHAGGQIDGDGAAQRMAEDVARPVGILQRQPVPCGSGVFIGRFFRWQASCAFAEAAVVDGQHRKPQLLHAPHSRCRASHVVTRAVQIQQHRRGQRIGQRERSRGCQRIGRSTAARRSQRAHTGRLVGLQPQAVQPYRVAARPGFERNPDIVHALGGGVTAAPAAVAGLEDPGALLFVKGAAAGKNGCRCTEGKKKSEGRPAFHGKHGVRRMAKVQGFTAGKPVGPAGLPRSYFYSTLALPGPPTG